MPSNRERDVLMLNAASFSSGRIGKTLLLSSEAVRTYRARIIQKLELTHPFA